jgi:ribosome-associated toxin RatA of RatAB toxin-antitoxin module
MVKLNYLHILQCDERKFWEKIINFKELPKYLSRQIQKIEILEENNNIIILNVTIFVRSLIKKEFSIQIKILKKSENELFLEVLDGFAKGTQSTVSISVDEDQSTCQVNTNIKFSLKTMILIPIIKKEYEGILIKIFRNIEGKIKEEKEVNENVND